MVLGARTRYATPFALFRVLIFRGSPLDHENHENITPRKIPAIRYIHTWQWISFPYSWFRSRSPRGGWKHSRDHALPHARLYILLIEKLFLLQRHVEKFTGR